MPRRTPCWTRPGRPPGTYNPRVIDPLRTAPAPRALVLNGALAAQPEVDAVAAQVASELGRLGMHATRVTLRDVPVAPCAGCFECWTRSPGVCKTRDDGRDLARAYVRADLVALVTPVTFGGYSSELKKALDRMICIDLPFFTRREGEVRHPLRYTRQPALLFVGVLRRPLPAQEQVFHALARRNALNMVPAAFASHVVVGGGEAIDPALRGAIAVVADGAGGRAGAAAAAGGAR
jgi:multimeric flavodoxin WrbA